MNVVDILNDLRIGDVITLGFDFKGALKQSRSTREMRTRVKSPAPLIVTCASAGIPASKDPISRYSPWINLVTSDMEPVALEVKPAIIWPENEFTCFYQITLGIGYYKVTACKKIRMLSIEEMLSSPIKSVRQRGEDLFYP